MATVSVVEKVAKRGRPSNKQKKSYALKKASLVFKQLSDPTRLEILLTLKENQKNVTELMHVVEQSQPNVSHHLSLLRAGGLVASMRQGKSLIYNLTSLGQEMATIGRDQVAVS